MKRRTPVFTAHFTVLVNFSCGWPALSQTPRDNLEPVRVMILADTHLLGSRNGHWFDKWRREYQMHRAFQTAMTLHKPELVFVLGDLFDEGKWCSQQEFNEYVQRFFELFEVPEGTKMYSVVGNHDIGFHYRITPQLVNRFETQLNAPPVRLLSLRGNHFVLINSMAMEGDGCSLCARAVTEIDKISALPLYRESDSVCTDPDAAPLPDRHNLFEERWDCLSRESTEYLVESLYPRAVLGAHTHHSCVVRHSFVPTSNHKVEFIEYTVPSFSWRNRPDPKYYLLTVSPDEVKVTRCGMPRERTMQVTAIAMLLALIVYLKCCTPRPAARDYKLGSTDDIVFG